MIAYGLMFLLAVGIGATVWWNLYHSHRRTYLRKQVRQRKKESVKHASPVPPPGMGA